MKTMNRYWNKFLNWLMPRRRARLISKIMKQDQELGLYDEHLATTQLRHSSITTPSMCKKRTDHKPLKFNNMKITIGEWHSYWASRMANPFYLLPSLTVLGYPCDINNLHTGRIQNHYEVMICFDFLYLSCSLDIHFMWGDKGEVPPEFYQDDDDYSPYDL